MMEKARNTTELFMTLKIVNACRVGFTAIFQKGREAWYTLQHGWTSETHRVYVWDIRHVRPHLAWSHFSETSRTRKPTGMEGDQWSPGAWGVTVHGDGSFFFFFPKYFFFNILLFSLLFSFFGCAKQHVGSWFPDQGSNLSPLHYKADSLTTGPPGKSPSSFLPRPLSSTGHPSPARAFTPSVCICVCATHSVAWTRSSPPHFVCYPSRSDGHLLLPKASPILAGPIWALPLFG